MSQPQPTWDVLIIGAAQTAADGLSHATGLYRQGILLGPLMGAVCREVL